MAVFFEAQHKNIKARMRCNNAVSGENLRGKLNRQGVSCGPLQEVDRSFFRPLDEVKRSQIILEVLLEDWTE